MNELHVELDPDDVAEHGIRGAEAETSRSSSTAPTPHTAELTDELTAGAPFTDRLQAPPILPQRTGVERLVHPDVGELRLAHEGRQAPNDL